VAETVLEAPAETGARVRVSPLVPCVLAWIVPGLGHVWLGRRGRGLVFFVVVMATFVLGITSGGASTVIDRQQPLSYLAIVDNLAIGPLDFVARRMTLGELVYRLPDPEADPRRQEIMTRVRDRVRIPTYEYGSTFLLAAGLMNILLILDAFDIASGRKD
jgi:hypothetical protein